MNHPIEVISAESYNKNLSNELESCELNSDDSDPSFRNVDSISSDDLEN